MANPFLFADVLGQLVERSAYSTGQLASLTTLPKTTIGNWLEGRVKRPRRWQGIVQLAVAMRLTESEANELLHAASHPTIPELRMIAKEDENGLLTFWETTFATAPPIPFQAISLPPYFVGRSEERASLKEAIAAAQEPAIYCLHGMAGVGKTSLAAEIAYHMRDHFEDGVLWARLDSSDTMSILATFAAAFQRDVSQYHDVASRSRIVRDLLADKQTLLVLDNAQSSIQIEPLLPPTGRCTVLVTTRRHDLAILSGTKRFEIRPFPANTTTSLSLFSQILGKERVTAEEAQLSHMANELGHLPLALVIAASRLAYEPGWQTDTFAARIQDMNRRLQALSYESQNVRRSFQLSYDQLNLAAKKLFATAGLLGRQHFSVATIAALSELALEEVEDHFRQLFSLSLCQVAGNGRYQLHPLLHDFAHSLPLDKGVTTRSVSYWSNFIVENRGSFAKLAEEMGHIEVALQIAISQKMSRLLILMLTNLMPCWVAQGSFGRTGRCLTDAATAMTSINETHALVQIHLLQGQLERHRQNLDVAEAYLQKGLQQTHVDMSPIQTAHFLAELGIIQTCRGQLTQGKQYLTDALQLARQDATASELLLNVLAELGVLAFMEGERDLAEQYYREGLTLATSHANKTHAVILLSSLGALRHVKRDHAEAKQLFTQGYALAQEIEFHKGLMMLGNNLGVLAFIEGDIAIAKNYLQAALMKAEQLLDLKAAQLLLNNLARLARHDGRFEESQAYFMQLLSLAPTKNDPQARMNGFKELGILASQQGNMESAAVHFEQAMTIARAGASRLAIAELQLAWGEAYLVQGNVESGADILKRLEDTIVGQNLPDAFRKRVAGRLLQIDESRNGGTLSISFPPEHLKVFI